MDKHNKSKNVFNHCSYFKGKRLFMLPVIKLKSFVMPGFLNAQIIAFPIFCHAHKYHL